MIDWLTNISLAYTITPFALLHLGIVSIYCKSGNILVWQILQKSYWNPTYLDFQYTLNKKSLNGQGKSMVMVLRRKFLVQWRNLHDFITSSDNAGGKNSIYKLTKPSPVCLSCCMTKIFCESVLNRQIILDMNTKGCSAPACSSQPVKQVPIRKTYTCPY